MSATRLLLGSQRTAASVPLGRLERSGVQVLRMRLGIPFSNCLSALVKELPLPLLLDAEAADLRALTWPSSVLMRSRRVPMRTLSTRSSSRSSWAC